MKMGTSASPWRYEAAAAETIYLAARLDVSERHLSRSLQAMFGISPKQFVRVARIERVMSMRAQGANWADIACATRFTDQAHMINDFNEIVGVPPARD